MAGADIMVTAEWRVAEGIGTTIPMGGMKTGETTVGLIGPPGPGVEGVGGAAEA